MEKNRVHISDAIPEMPASFDEATERTLDRVCRNKRQEKTVVRQWTVENGTQRKRGSGRRVFDIVAVAAIFAICTVAIGAVIAFRPRAEKVAPALQTDTETSRVSTARTVHVSTVDEFLAALAPDTEIVLADGTYDLTTAADYGTDQVGYYTWTDRSNNWLREKEENSFELEIRNLENVRIVGSRNAQIVTVPRTAAVLSVQSCTGLELSGFTAGHTVMADPCEGEVIRAVECANLRVENCSLYGCGTWGVSATDCDNLVVNGSDIHECSSGGLSLVRCRNTRVTECTVRDCGYRDEAFSIFYIFDCADLTISNCDVYGSKTETVFKLYNDWEEPASERIFLLGTSVHNNTVSEYGIYNTPEGCLTVDGCEFRDNSGALLPEDQFVFDRDGNRLYEADLAAMQLDRTGDAAFNALPTPAPKPSEEPNREAPQSDVSYYYLVNSVPVYPYEGFVWESKPELEADGVGVQLEDEKVRSQIPVTEYNVGTPFAVLTADGWQLDEITVSDAAYERIIDVAGNRIPWEEGNGYVATDLLKKLSPGTYYLSAIVSYRAEKYSIGNEIAVCLRVKEASEAPEPTEEPPMQESSAVPSTFRFWDYDEKNGYREAPAEGVLFVCDFDGDGTEDEIAYKINGQYLTISVGKASVEVSFGAGLEQAILLDLDPDSTRLNLLAVYNTGSEDYETAELHMENGRFVRGPVIYAYCSVDGDTVRGSATQTDILGTRIGGRTYHGEEMTPDSEWFDCDVIPDDIQTASDRVRLIEGGKLLHLVRDLPCTIDGEDAVIPAGTYLYMTRWHESGTLAEIRTEDGTTALLTVERADPLDPELYGYLIDGATQDTYFDNIFYAD